MRLRTAALAATLPATLLVTTGPAPAASAACAARTSRSVSVSVFGQDGRDVNASVGFSVVDAAGRALAADPAAASYGCASTGGYSVPQTYLNHFVSFEGAPRGSRMSDGTTTRRDVRIGSLPANAASVWVEVYARGYAGSPCRDSRGAWCFNPTDVRKYGYANKIKIPVGRQGVRVPLPTTCRYGGTAGSIAGRGVDAAGRAVRLRQVYAWTEHAWDAAPAVHGWGADKPAGTGYALRSLASGQRYVVWAYGPRGNRVVRKGVLVQPCRTTPLTLRV